MLAIPKERDLHGGPRSQVVDTGRDHRARALVANSSEFPVGLVVDEVFGFRRFVDRELADEAPATKIRADRFLAGCFRRGGEVWPVFSLTRLLEARDFQRAAGE